MGRRVDLFCSPTPEEVSASLPGDEIIDDPVGVTNHAIDIQAPPDAVWPWLAQMGADRAGWYSYDAFDNGGRTSISEIRPDLQDIAVGTLFPALPGATDCFILTGMKAPEFLVLSVPGADGVSGDVGSEPWRRSFDRANWTFRLTAKGGGTRLLARSRLGFLTLRLVLFGDTLIPRPIARLLMRPVHFIMQRKQLNEIRKRAEGRVE